MSTVPCLHDKEVGAGCWHEYSGHVDLSMGQLATRQLAFDRGRDRQMTRDGWRREDEREEAGWCGSPPSPSAWPSSWQRAVMGRVSEQAPILSPETQDNPIQTFTESRSCPIHGLSML